MDSRIDNMIANPRKHFSGPFDVLDHDELAFDEKRRILESWKFDAQQLADGTAENMTGGEETDLRDVSKALVQLKALDEAPTLVTAKRRQRRGASMALSVITGAVVGAGAGLVLLSVASIAPVATLTQTTIAGGVIGGLVRIFRRAVHV